MNWCPFTIFHIESSSGHSWSRGHGIRLQSAKLTLFVWQIKTSVMRKTHTSRSLDPPRCSPDRRNSSSACWTCRRTRRSCPPACGYRNTRGSGRDRVSPGWSARQSPFSRSHYRICSHMSPSADDGRSSGSRTWSGIGKTPSCRTCRWCEWSARSPDAATGRAARRERAPAADRQSFSNADAAPADSVVRDRDRDRSRASPRLAAPRLVSRAVRSCRAPLASSCATAVAAWHTKRTLPHATRGSHQDAMTLSRKHFHSDIVVVDVVALRSRRYPLKIIVRPARKEREREKGRAVNDTPCVLSLGTLNSPFPIDFSHPNRPSASKRNYRFPTSSG